MLNQELLSQPMRIELYGVQRAKASKEWERQQRYVELIGILVGERRVSDAERAKQDAEEVERQSFGKHQLVQELAQNNTLLTGELTQLAVQVDEISSDAVVVVDQIKRFSSNFRLARQKLEIAGLSEALGQALLQQRNNLPRVKDFRSAENRRQQLVVESSLRQIRNQQERAQLSDIDAYVDGVMQPLSASWQSWIRDEIHDLAQQRRDLLDKAIAMPMTVCCRRSASSILRSVSCRRWSVITTSSWTSGCCGCAPAIHRPGRWCNQVGARSRCLLPGRTCWISGHALVRPQFFPWVLLLGLLVFALLLKLTPAMRASLRRSSRKVGQLRHDRLHHSIGHCS